MNSLICSVVSYLANATWEIPLIAIAGWAVSHLQKKIGPNAQHATWVMTLVLAVLTPAFSLYRMLPIFPHVSAQNLTIAITAIQDASAIERGSTTLPVLAVLMLFCCYAVVLVYFSARLLWSLSWTFRLVRQSQPVSVAAGRNEIWSRCTQSFSLQNVAILCSQSVSGPVTVGFKTPALLVPPLFLEQCTEHDLLAAFAHECAHIKRRDFQKNVVYEIASLLIAFHPVTWMLKAQITQTREMICDAMASERLIDSQRYSQSLLRLAQMIAHGSYASASQAIGIFDANILEKRIMQMREKKPHVGVAIKHGLTISGILVMGVVAAGAGTLARPIETQSAGSGASSSSSEKHSSSDLACTYYDHGQGYPGTCGTRAGDESHYYCTVNGNKSLSQEQVGCEWKVKRMAEAGISSSLSPAVYHVGGDVSAPRVVFYKDPEFPTSARKGSEPFDGICVLSVVVDASGTPGEVRVVRSLGEEFDASAMNAVQQYRFSPAMRAGVAVPVQVNLEVHFKKY
jgi:TonB family protein